MSLRSRVPTIQNWCNITNKELAWRLAVLAKYKPELYLDFKVKEARYMCYMLNNKWPKE